jgi:hypothetical protein
MNLAPMPEASIHKYHHAFTRECKIRAAEDRQTTSPSGNSMIAQNPDESEFRRPISF